MRILYICNKSPYPPNEGGSLGMYVFIKGMVDAGHQVKVLAFNTNKSYIQSGRNSCTFCEADWN